MRNSTSTTSPLNLFTKKIFFTIATFFLLMALALSSRAQSTGSGFVPVYVPNPTGIVNPSDPTAAPQQFTTNLVSVANTGNVTLDGNIAVLDNSFSNAVDAADAVKTINNLNENFSLVRNNTNLVIEARQQVLTTDTLYYNMWNLNQQDYQLEFFPINMIKPGLTAILVDRYLITRSVIDLAAAPTYYPFTVSTDPGSFAADRFILILFQADPGPLPVDFISIGAAKSSAGVQVTWKVAGERAIINYSIEKSANGRNFSSAGTVTATGSGYVDRDITYTWKDISNVAALQYYRIKSNGVNGEAKYSPIVKVAAGDIKSSISVLSNPVKGSSINLQLTKVPKGRYEVNLSGIDGKLIFTRSIQHAGESAIYPMAVPAVVSRGTYVLSVISPDMTRQAQVLVMDQDK